MSGYHDDKWVDAEWEAATEARCKASPEDALRAVVAAWESLPGNRRYTPAEVERWLREDMGPAINRARAALTPTRPPKE